MGYLLDEIINVLLSVLDDFLEERADSYEM